MNRSRVHHQKHRTLRRPEVRATCSGTRVDSIVAACQCLDDFRFTSIPAARRLLRATGNSGMSCLLQELCVFRINALWHETVSDDILVEEHFEPDATQQILAG